MTASREDIEEWLREAAKRGATHLIVVCETWDHANSPEYVMPGRSVDAAARQIRSRDGYSIDEIYDLSRPLRPQLEEVRAFHPGHTRKGGIP